MNVNEDSIYKKIKTLNETIWERRATRRPHIEQWLGNFKGELYDKKIEQKYALFMLSNFMYFGIREIRELIKALYRDKFKYPIVSKIRKLNNDTTDLEILNESFREELTMTRFLGVGNPSESGTHLLYYFRQENFLHKKLFINTHDIFTRTPNKDKHKTIKDPDIKRYVFIDDFCGSGTQAKEYSKEIVEEIKELSPKAEVHYLVLFSTEAGLQDISKHTMFDDVSCVFSLDDSYKCFGPESRTFANQTNKDRDTARDIAKHYGRKLWRPCPLGYKDGQFLIGFFHNTPDNTLPIIWHESTDGHPWQPILKRYHKIYG